MNGKKQNFFAWYFEQGVHELLEIIKNYLVFFWRFFSVPELLFTLFAPWHRDVTIKTWRGLHPIRSLEIMSENIFSRCIGALIRTVVIGFGILWWLGALVVAGAVLFVWLAFPFVTVALFWFVSRGAVAWQLAVGWVVAWSALVIWAYLNDRRASLLHISFAAFWRSKIFDRICARLGTDRSQFKQEFLDLEDQLVAFLKSKDVTLAEYKKILAWELGSEERRQIAGKFWRQENLHKIAAVGGAWKYGYTANLDRYAADLCAFDSSDYRAAELIGRQEELEVLKLLLERPDQNCALLVGPSGIGKKTLVHHLGRLMRENELGGFFQNKRLLLLDLGRAISDALNRGLDVENELRRLFIEAAYAGNVILVVEHFEHYLGKEGNVFHPDISAVLAEFLDLPTFQLIGTSTTKEYHKLLEKQENIVKYFEVIEMREPTEEEALKILFEHFVGLESKRVVFTFAALREILASCNRLNWEFPLPERALDLAMNVLMFWEKKADSALITPETVLEFVSLKTGTPQGAVEGSERKKLLEMENILHRHVIGQDEAISQVAQALRRARSGIGNTNKPIGSFLFMGPTGVGKTETAKALAKAYFGDEHKLIRLDMSEYQSPSSLDHLIGSSQLGQPGLLVTKVKDNPFGLLLLDEIEKAYPEILDLFLQVLDEGFLTDAFGEKINFRNMIIIATSNAGAPLIKDLLAEGQDSENVKNAVLDAVVAQGTFRLEFLNRFSSVVFFKPLSAEQLVSVVQLQLKKFARKLSKEKNIEIEFGAGVVEHVIEKGYNPMFGARSLNRYLEETVEDLVARKIIAGEVARGEKLRIEF